MPTPDELAAALPPSTWKDRPLPVIGRNIKITYPVKHNGRTSWQTTLGVVEQVSQPAATSLIVKLGNGKSYLLNSGSLLDKWEYVAQDVPVRATQAIIDSGYMAGGRDPEHENRLANDPLYRHYWDTIQSEIGTAGLDRQEDDVNPFGLDLSDEPEENTPDGLPDPYAETLAARMRRLEYLDDQMKSLKAQIDGLQSEYDQVCATAMEQMSQEGVPSITVDGNTWYMKAKTFVEKLNGVTTDNIREALIASGYRSMLTETYNSNSLRSLLTEFRDSEGQIPVPDALAAVVRLGQTTMIGRTRAAAHKRKAPVSPPS